VPLKSGEIERCNPRAGCGVAPTKPGFSSAQTFPGLPIAIIALAMAAPWGAFSSRYCFFEISAFARSMSGFGML
jgi:hypothetical protein